MRPNIHSPITIVPLSFFVSLIYLIQFFKTNLAPLGMSLQFLILSPLSQTTQFYSWATGGGLIAQLCLTLCDPLDCKLPGSSDHAVFQARILEWVAISFCSASSRPRD